MSERRRSADEHASLRRTRSPRSPKPEIGESFGRRRLRRIEFWGSGGLVKGRGVMVRVCGSGGGGGSGVAGGEVSEG